MKTLTGLETIHDAIYKLTHHSDTPAKAQASDIGISYKKLNDSCLESAPSNHHRTEWILKQTISAKNTILLDFMERKIGRVGVPVFDPWSPHGQEDEGDLTAEVLKAAKELGEMAAVIQESLKGDNKIDRDEAIRCQKETWDLVIQATKVYQQISQLAALS